MTLTPLRYVFRGHHEAGFFRYCLRQGGDSSLIAAAPESRPPVGEPYVCFIPVLDYARMLKEYTDQHGLWHYSGVIDRDLQEDVRARRALLVFDHSNEGPEFQRRIFAELLAYLDSHRLPADQVVWISQNRLMGEAYRAAFGGSRQDHLHFEHYDYFVKNVAADACLHLRSDLYGSDHRLFARAMCRQTEKDSLLLCLNYTPRFQRIIALAAILERGWLGESIVSFPGLDTVKEPTSADRIHSLLDENPAFAHLRPAVNVLLSLGRLTADGFKERGNWLVAKIDPRLYLRSYLSLVTESDFFAAGIKRVTEKTAKAYCLGHPCLIFGNPHSVRLMAEYGFATWSDVIDPEYDDEVSPARRHDRLIAELGRQIAAIRSDPEEWLRRVRPACEANIQFAASGGFLKQYRERFDIPILTRLRQRLRLDGGRPGEAPAAGP
jgi:hypothetical protein